MIAQKTVDTKHSYEPRHRPVATSNFLTSAFGAFLSNHIGFTGGPRLIVNLCFCLMGELQSSVLRLFRGDSRPQ